MALQAATDWEVRSTGNDNNGGGFFISGVAPPGNGIDRSQQDTAFKSGTNLTVDAVTNTDVLPDGYTPVDPDDKFNVIQISAGAGFTAGFYYITQIVSGKWRLDRSPAAVGTSGATWAMGGALATPAKALASMVSDNIIWMKGSFTTTASLSLPVVNGRIIGYVTSRGESTGGQASITLSTNTGLSAFLMAAGATGVWGFYNFNINCAGLGTSSGINIGSATGVLGVRNVKVTNWKTNGINLGANGQVVGCELTGSTAGNGINALTNCIIEGCYIHDNTGVTPINATGIGGTIFRNLLANNTGSVRGISLTTPQGWYIRNNTLYRCGREGIRSTGGTEPSTSQVEVSGNLLVSNGVTTPGPGISLGTLSASTNLDGNAYYNNTGTISTATLGRMNYTYVRNAILTVDPFVNAAGNDFRLNNNVGGGALCRGIGAVGAIPGLSVIGYPDYGCLQHIDPARLHINPGMSGGMNG